MFMPGFYFYEVKKNIIFQKEKGKTFTLFVFKKSKIAQIYYYDPQSARIKMQWPQSDSTPWTLTLINQQTMPCQMMAQV